jgi:SAM-dependent methyltransferase
MPTEAELEQAYADWYRPAVGRFGGLGDALLRRTRGRLAGRLDRIAPAGPVLDVGAGDGALLDALRARARKAVGIDRRSSHPAIREGELDEIGSSWAAVVFWHSLEHLFCSGAALGHAVSILQPGGVLVVALPNPGSIQAEVFGDRWFALDYPRHLAHIPSSVLLARLAELQMGVERVSYLRGGQVVFGWLHGFVGWLPRHPDLYDAIRRPAARRRPMRPPTRIATLAAAILLLPWAVLCGLAEAALRRGGTIYVEARRV